MKKVLPTFEFEKKLWKKGYVIIGVDEVGRGALAGPLFVGAVCFQNSNLENIGIDDSKRLSAKRRKEFSEIIKKQAFASDTAWVSVSYINRRGIVKGSQAAMRKVINKLINRFNNKKIFLLSDAFYIKYVRGIGLKNQMALVRGDQRSISIAAASIIAKVKRDHIMYKLYQKYPEFDWKKNKGYGTKRHITAIKKYGKSKLHRTLYLRKISSH